MKINKIDMPAQNLISNKRRNSKLTKSLIGAFYYDIPKVTTDDNGNLLSKENQNQLTDRVNINKTTMNFNKKKPMNQQRNYYRNNS